MNGAASGGNRAVGMAGSSGFLGSVAAGALACLLAGCGPHRASRSDGWGEDVGHPGQPAPPPADWPRQRCTYTCQRGLDAGCWWSHPTSCMDECLARTVAVPGCEAQANALGDCRLGTTIACNGNDGLLFPDCAAQESAVSECLDAHAPPPVELPAGASSAELCQAVCDRSAAAGCLDGADPKCVEYCVERTASVLDCQPVAIDQLRCQASAPVACGAKEAAQYPGCDQAEEALLSCIDGSFASMGAGGGAP